jgi:hypothetical protein
MAPREAIMPELSPIKCSATTFCAPLRHSITPDTAPMVGVLELMSLAEGVRPRVGAKATKRHALIIFNFCPFCGTQLAGATSGSPA